jgi:uncharacterized membrane protein
MPLPMKFNILGLTVFHLFSALLSNIFLYLQFQEDCNTIYTQLEMKEYLSYPGLTKAFREEQYQTYWQFKIVNCCAEY